MVISPEKIAANQRNAAKSSGPRTAEGKANSRRNSLKHGLTGAGVVLPVEDEAALEFRFAQFEAELKPDGEVAGCLVRRAALLTIRQERCVRYESAVVSIKMRQAEADFDEARLVEVERLVALIPTEPVLAVHRLTRSPEGIARLIEEFKDIRFTLTSRLVVWNFAQGDRVEALAGRHLGSYPRSTVRALTEVVMNQRNPIMPDHLKELTDRDRISWARTQIAEQIDAHIARLQHLRDAIDLDAINQDRQDSVDLAIFEASNDLAQVRKYEAATTRELKQTYQELRRLQQAPKPVAANPDPKEVSGPVGSFAEVETVEPPTPSPRPSSPAPTMPEVVETAQVELSELLKRGLRRFEGAPG